MSAQDERHWDRIVEGWPSVPSGLWRPQSDLVNARLLDRWLPGEVERLLKTDLFDELAGQGLLPRLQDHAADVVGMDISPRAAAAARERFPQLEIVESDVRELPFPDAHFDAIFSPSTLDHLHSRSEVAQALAELARTLRPGGRLVITLDNPLNPLIALRNVLPRDLVARLRRVPYDTGWTCTPRTLRTMLEAAGLDVRETTAVLHFPRALAARFDAIPMRAILAAERLERLPTRYLTGHFVAALSIRR